MANPHRGEVELKAGDKTYTLVYTINSLCELEKTTEKSVDEVLSEINSGNPRLLAIRDLFWAGLLKHHKMTVNEAGEVMDEAGPILAAVTSQKAIALALVPADDAAKDAPVNPR